MEEFETFAQWWKADGMKLEKDGLSDFEIARRAWYVGQTTIIRNNNKEK